MSIYILYAIGVVFGFCEFGQRLSDAFDEIDDEIEAFDWYSFTHELQQMLPTILMVTQQPVVIECFGSISGLRECFKKVSLIHTDILLFYTNSCFFLFFNSDNQWRILVFYDNA